MMMRFQKLTCTVVSTLVIFGLPQVAQAYPDKVVTLVVPFTAGSGSDIIARIIAPKLAERWKQPVIVDNKPGASGTIGADAVAKANPDGHTLLMAINSFTMAPNLFKKPPFDPGTDFTPVMKMAVANFGMFVNAQIPANDVAGVIALAKSKPGNLQYGSAGNGTPHHLAMELLKQQAGVDILHVPYKGVSNAITDLLGGHVQVMFASVHSMLPHVRSGRVKMLGVTGQTRTALANTVPTFKEQSIDYLDAVDAWYAVFTPLKISPDIVSQLVRDVNFVLALPEVRDQMAAQGLMIQTSTPEQLGVLVKSDYARWKKTVADAKITAD
jgi:tripartite-type tricarboxylate transporter receptor subunit TctC